VLQRDDLELKYKAEEQGANSDYQTLISLVKTPNEMRNTTDGTTL